MSGIKKLIDSLVQSHLAEFYDPEKLDGVGLNISGGSPDVTMPGGGARHRGQFARAWPGGPMVDEDSSTRVGSADSKQANAGKIQKVLQQNADLLRDKKGIDVSTLKPLGQGSYGVAFDLGGGKVLKVTRDITEAKSSNYIKGKNHKHIVHVFDVWKFKDVVGYFGLVLEQLQPLSSAEKMKFKAAERLLAACTGQTLETARGRSWSEFMERAAKSADDDCEDKMEEAFQQLEELQVDMMVDEVLSAGISFSDYHTGNVMKRSDGTFVVTDLGQSVSKGAVPPVLEAPSFDDVGGFQQAAARGGKKMISDPEIAGKLAKKLGVDVTKAAKFLGAGTYGSAWDLGDGRVLKVTRDESEARSSMHIKGKKTKHVVRVFDVFMFPYAHGFGVVQEKLQPLSSAEKKAIDKAIAVLDELSQDDSMSLMAARDWKNFEELMRGSWRPGPVLDDINGSLEVLKAANFDKMVAELTSMGVRFNDYHTGNIMKRGNEFVVIDIGQSKSPGKEPPVLEGKGSTIVYRGLRGLNDRELKKIGGDPNRRIGTAKVQWKGSGHWTANIDVAKAYAGTPSAKERNVDVTFGGFRVIVRGRSDGKPQDTGGVIPNNSNVIADRIWWTVKDADIENIDPETMPEGRLIEGSGKTVGELKAWLKEAVPVLVYLNILCARAVKVCGGISDNFANMAREAGFDAWVASAPGHFLNWVSLSDDAVQVDMSHVQFEARQLASKFADDDYSEDDPFGEVRAVQELLRKVAANPFAAIDVKKIPAFEPEEQPHLRDPSPNDGPFKADFEKTKGHLDKFIKGGRMHADDPFMKVFMTSPDSSKVDAIGEKKEPEKDGINPEGYPIEDRVEFQGIPVAIENRKGSVRKGKWPMHFDYGYVEGAIGSDGEDVDVYLGPDGLCSWAYVVHQMKQPEFQEYDEDKVMLGFSSEEDARCAYLKQYDDDGFYGGMSSMPMEKFKEKLLDRPSAKLTNEVFKWPAPSVISQHLYAPKEMPIKEIPAGTVIYHGTRSKFDDVNEMTWFAFSEKPAMNYARQEADGPEEPHVKKFVVKKALKLFAYPSVLDHDQVCAASFWATKHFDVDFNDVGFARVPKAFKAVCDAGYDGIYIEKEDNGFPSMMICRPDAVGKTEGKKRKRSGIPHIEDLTNEEFSKIAAALQLGTAIVTEKIDGSAFMKFGFFEGRLWAASKNMGPFFESSQWPKIRSTRALQRAHEVLESVGDVLASRWPEGLRHLTCEVLDGPVPNVLEYGPNAVVLHDPRMSYIFEGVNVEGWTLASVPMMQLDVFGGPRKLMEQLLVRWVRGQRPVLGGQMIEGMVIEAGDLQCKVVDRKVFTELNKFNWKIRELLDEGTGGGESWRPGLRRLFRSMVADSVLRWPAVKSANFVGYVKKNFGHMPLSETLSILVGGDGISMDVWETVLDLTEAKFNEVCKEWNEHPNQIVLEGKTFSMHPAVAERTREAIRETVDWLRSLRRIMPTPMNVLRVAIGENRWSKLREADLFGGTKEPGKEPMEKAGEDVNDPKVAAKLLTLYGELLKTKKGIDVSSARELGSGTQGTTFDIGNGRVLKVTADRKEAVASNKIKGKSLRHVVRIEDVFRFRDVPVYGIVLEKLTEMSNDDKSTLKVALIKTRFPVHIYYAGYDWDAAIDRMYDETAKKAGGYDTKEVRDLELWVDTMEKKYRLKEMFDELKGEGVMFHDFTPDNVMKRGAEYVITDLGLSKVEGGAEPDVLEKVVYETIRGALAEDSRGTIKKMFGLPKFFQDFFHHKDPKNSFVLAKHFYLYWKKIGTDFKKLGTAKPADVKTANQIFDQQVDVPVPDNLDDPKNNKAWDDWIFDWEYHGGFALEDLLKKRPSVEKSLKHLSTVQAIDAFVKEAEDDEQQHARAIKNSILEFPDGFYWVDLKTSHCDVEAQKMGHCGRDSSGELVSLRDKKNEPHVTMTWDKTKNIVMQIKGKQNSEPDRKYWSYVKAFFEKTGSKIDSQTDISDELADLLPGKRLKVGGYTLVPFGGNDYTKDAYQVKGKDGTTIFYIISDDELKTIDVAHEPFKGSALPEGKNFIEAVKAIEAIVTELRPKIGKHTVETALYLYRSSQYSGEGQDILDALSKGGRLDATSSALFNEKDHEEAKWARALGGKAESLDNTIYEVVKSMFEDDSDDGTDQNNIPDNIGVTIGRFQPFHVGHASIIRDLAQRFDKVIILVAGNKESAKNPFSFKTRVELMKASLQDVLPKLEVHRGDSGFLPGILSDLAREGGSSVKETSAVNVLVGSDRLEDIRGQVERSKKLDMAIDPNLIAVQQLPRSEDEESVSGASASKIRDALANDRKDDVAKMLDPHVVSDPAAFDDLYARLREELGRYIPLDEDLEDIGGEEGIQGVLMKNKEKLLTLKKIDVDTAKALGHGKMGVAYDIGGGRVLKVTSDAKEAKSSNHVKNKKLDHVVAIFDVFRFKDSEPPVYGIVQEKLEPLSSEEQTGIDRAFDSIDNDPKLIQVQLTGDFEKLMAYLYDAIESDVEKELFGDGGSNNDPAKMAKIRTVAQRRFGFQKALLKKYKVPEMMADLRRVNIEFADYHKGNIMKRGEDYVINDLGLSNSPGAEPPTLEGIVEQAVLEMFGGAGTMTGIGGTQSGTRAGSSPWSSPMRLYTDDERERDPDAIPDL